MRRRGVGSGGKLFDVVNFVFYKPIPCIERRFRPIKTVRRSVSNK